MSPTVASPFPQSAGGPQRFFTFEKPPLTSSASTDSITSSVSSFSSGSTVSSLATVKTLDSSRAASPATGEADIAQDSAQVAGEEVKSKSPSPTPLLNAAAIAANIAAANASASRPTLPTSTSAIPSPPTSQPINTNTTSMPAPPLSAHPIHPPPSPFAAPLSARTPRRLYIPQSPYTPGGGPIPSPMSATACHSPFSSTMSPREWESLERVGNRIPPLSAGLIGSAAAAAAGVSGSGSGSGSSRSFIRTVTTTRTVHYGRGKGSQTPIVEPVPQWKKRKVGP